MSYTKYNKKLLFSYKTMYRINNTSRDIQIKIYQIRKIKTICSYQFNLKTFSVLNQ